jgi:uncharacterized protein YegJ (DUF2314 family)
MVNRWRAALGAGLVACVAALGCGVAGKSGGGSLITSGYDEKEMEAAIAKARATTDRFILELKLKNGEDFGVKAPITDPNGTEHFWLTDVTYSEATGEFKGNIGNEPEMVKNVRMGQSWTIKRGEISDWMFFRDRKMHGNYTIRPLLATLPAEEAAQYRAMLAEP